MKIALSVWKDCISTVFDAADQLLVVEKDGNGALKRTTIRINSADGPSRATQLKDTGIDILICGAISRPQEAAILAAGITVYPFVRGPVQQVIAAYENGQLHSTVFTLPGCRERKMGVERSPGRCRRRSGQRHHSATHALCHATEKKH